MLVWMLLVLMRVWNTSIKLWCSQCDSSAIWWGQIVKAMGSDFGWGRGDHNVWRLADTRVTTLCGDEDWDEELVSYSKLVCFCEDTKSDTFRTHLRAEFAQFQGWWSQVSACQGSCVVQAMHMFRAFHAVSVFTISLIVVSVFMISLILSYGGFGFQWRASLIRPGRPGLPQQMSLQHKFWFLWGNAAVRVQYCCGATTPAAHRCRLAHLRTLFITRGACPNAPQMHTHI